MTIAARRPTLARRNSRPSVRRGYVSILALMLIVIGVVTLLLVVNWTYLVFASRRTLQYTDTLALSVVADLLDDEALLKPSARSAPAVAQDDDVIEAEDRILDPGTGFLALNNAGLSERLRPTAAEVTITPGYVDDASAPVSGTNALNLAPDTNQNERYNSLRVEIFRDPTGLNPVYLLMRGFGAPETAKISGSSIATLDSRVVGYRPRISAPSPVAPFAILEADWILRDSEPGTDDNHNNKLEMDFALRSNTGGGTSNAVLINVNTTGGTVNTSVIPDQIATGLVPTDVNPTGVFGPLAKTAPLTVAATDVSPSNVNDIADEFDNLTQPGNDKRRVFPLLDNYDDNTGTATLVGFIAADVLAAGVVDSGQGPRLVVRLEPTFIVHFTAETRRVFPGTTSVPENVYCHKIRLTH